MTGPEHYKHAESLLESADIAAGQYEEHGWQSKLDMAHALTAEAQVHATLALAAAAVTAPADLDRWYEVTLP